MSPTKAALFGKSSLIRMHRERDISMMRIHHGGSTPRKTWSPIQTHAAQGYWATDISRDADNSERQKSSSVAKKYADTHLGTEPRSMGEGQKMASCKESKSDIYDLTSAYVRFRGVPDKIPPFASLCICDSTVYCIDQLLLPSWRENIRAAVVVSSSWIIRIAARWPKRNAKIRRRPVQALRHQAVLSVIAQR